MPSPTSNSLWTDSHFHVFSAGKARPGARYVPAYDAAFETWQAEAGAAGVRRGVIVQPSFLGSDNSRLCAELRRHGDVLRGVAVIDPGSTPEQLRELARCGVRGVRLNLSGASHELGAWKQATALWDQILLLGWHVELHTDAGALPHVLPQLPHAMPLVIDHMAKPAAASAADPTIAMLRVRVGVTQVHVKLSGAYRLPGIDARALAGVLRDELGSRCLLWGSDWPCTNHEALADYSRLLAPLDEWVGTDAAVLALTQNPHALYWAGTEPGATALVPQSAAR